MNIMHNHQTNGFSMCSPSWQGTFATLRMGMGMGNQWCQDLYHHPIEQDIIEYQFFHRVISYFLRDLYTFTSIHIHLYSFISIHIQLYMYIYICIISIHIRLITYLYVCISINHKINVAHEFWPPQTSQPLLTTFDLNKIENMA